MNPALAALLLLLLATTLPAAELRHYPNATLVPATVNDGDSFMVDIDGRRLHVRLYFVDSPETTTGARSDVRRIREQSRHFGLPKVSLVLDYGHHATEFVTRVLQRPFTVVTAMARAPGRSKTPRMFAFITTADGDDLGEQLIRNGLARAYGTGRETASGDSRKEMFARLHDLEAAAMLAGAGIWEHSDPRQLAALRAEQRREDQELRTLQQQLKPRLPTGTLDLNTSSSEQLRTLPGIGLVKAKRIIARRPYRRIDDLLRVQGIGPATLDNLRPFVTVGPP